MAHTNAISQTNRRKDSHVKSRGGEQSSGTDQVLGEIVSRRLTLLYEAGRQFGYGPEYVDILVDDFTELLKTRQYDDARQLYSRRGKKIVQSGTIDRAKAESAFDEIRGDFRRYKPRLRKMLREAVE